MALSTTTNYSLRKHDAGDLNWDVDVNWNMTEIDKKLKLLFANFLTCSTAIGTAAKTAAFSNFVLETGCLIAVKFTNGNSASEPTLDVNSTGAKAIQVNGAAVAAGAIVPNGVYLLAYDGTNWAMLTREMVFDASSTVKGVIELATNAEVLAGTDNERAVTPAGLLAGFPTRLRSNLLGTVSQTGGVPTGAVIESGSNTNGSYVKFADGTMICRWKPPFVSVTVPPLTASGPHPWTYPATFIDPWAIVARVDYVGAYSASLRAYVAGTGASSLNIYVVSENTSETLITIVDDVLMFSAIGRWF